MAPTPNKPPTPAAPSKQTTADRESAPPQGGLTEDEAAGLSDEQRVMEEKRRETDPAAGTGAMAPPVHGLSRRPENTGGPVNRTKPDPDTKERDETKRTRKVRAIRLGYYDDRRRRTGDVFLIRPPYKVKDTTTKSREIRDKDKDREKKDEYITIDEFSSSWMEDVDAGTPERTTSGKEDLRRQHDETMAARHPTGDKDVIGKE